MSRASESLPHTQRLHRLLTIIHEIKTNPQQKPEALYRELGISKSMFFKDRLVLGELGFAFRYDRRQEQYIITRDAFMPVLNLTMSETLALIMAVRQLASTGDHTLTYDAIVAIRKILANAPAEYRQFFSMTLDEEVLQEGFGCDAGILDDLWRACQEHQRVMITHESGEESRQWQIDPYQILFKRRALYLDACVVSERQVKLFRINRIKRVDFQGIRVPAPLVAYNFRERHRHSFSVFVGEQVQRVRIRFFPDASMRQFITETRWHHSQQIEALPDGGFIFQVDVWEPREVGWWALQWGASAEVLEPVSLRQEMAETAEKLAGLYGQG